MKALKQRGVVNSSEACPFAEVPLVYRILSGKHIHAVPFHCLVDTAIKAVWIFLYLLQMLFLSFPFGCLGGTEQKHTIQKVSCAQGYLCYFKQVWFKRDS